MTDEELLLHAQFINIAVTILQYICDIATYRFGDVAIIRKYILIILITVFKGLLNTLSAIILELLRNRENKLLI